MADILQKVLPDDMEVENDADDDEAKTTISLRRFFPKTADLLTEESLFLECSCYEQKERRMRKKRIHEYIFPFLSCRFVKEISIFRGISSRDRAVKD